MTKITLSNVGSLTDSTTAQNTINNNFDVIETAFDNTLSRDGTSPNQMEAALDMNSNPIINLPIPTSLYEPVRVVDLSGLDTGGSIVVNPLPAGGTTSQVLKKNSNTNYDVSWSTPNYIPNGGTTSQTLIKNSNVDYDISWGSVNNIPVGGLTGQVLTKHSNANFDTSWVSPNNNIYNAVVDGGVDNTGATNTYTSLATAITTASSLKKALYLPTGTYNITGNRLRIPSGMTVFGDGPFLSVIIRNDNTTLGTVEVYNASNVRIQGIGINYTPGSYTLGYGQAGFAVRNGSTNVVLTDCAVQGKMNRAFHILNSAVVTVKNCYAMGSGDACLRVVCDLQANLYPEVADETSPILVKEVIITENTFTGATAMNGTTRAGTFYGINVATQSAAAGDLVEDVVISNNVVRYTDLQGIAIGGNIFGTATVGNVVQAITNGSSGVGILLQPATDSPVRHTISGNVCKECFIGVYVLASFAVITGNQCGSNNHGFLISTCNFNTITGNVAESSSQNGFYLTGSCTYCTFTGNVAAGNVGYGFKADGVTDHIVWGNNASASNTAGAQNILGTNAKIANNSWN